MTGSQPLVLLIEDETTVHRFLGASLPARGLRLMCAETGREGLARAAEYAPDIILLDLGLPDMDGLEVTRRVREWSNAPIIVLSARGQEQDKIAALDAGADDYLTKPFSVGELLARIRAALRRLASSSQGDSSQAVITIGDLRVDLVDRRVCFAGNEVRLTPTEYKILAVLVHHPGHLEDVHYLRVYMTQLRRKIEPDPTRPRYLLTEAGVGYRCIDS
jgi:two-component system KDP operon response regulator KdpE